MANNYGFLYSDVMPEGYYPRPKQKHPMSLISDIMERYKVGFTEAIQILDAGNASSKPKPAPILQPKYKKDDFLAVWDGGLKPKHMTLARAFFFKVTKITKDEFTRRITYTGKRYFSKEAMPDEDLRFSINGAIIQLDLEQSFQTRPGTEAEFREITARHPLTTIFV